MGEVGIFNNGNVIGPASSTDNAVVRYDGTSGKVVQNSGVTIDDSNNVVTPGGVSAGTTQTVLNADGSSVFNESGAAVDTRFETDTHTHALFIQGSSDGVGFNTDDPTFTQEGTAKPSSFLALKSDVLNGNAGAFGMASTTSSRAVDVTFLKSAGSWASKSATASNEVIANLGFAGYDGTDFNRSALFQVAGDGAVSADTVPLQMVFQTSQTNNGGLLTRMRIRANGIVQIGGGATFPVVTFDATNGATVINEQANSAGDLRVEGGSNTNLIRTIASSNRVAIGSSGPVSTFETNGSRGIKVATLSATTLTLGETHEVIAVGHTATAAVTITLPSATSSWNSTSSIGRRYTIKDTGCNAGTNNITINRAGSDTITTTTTGNTSVVIATNGQTLIIQAISSSVWAVWVAA
jgi:hypothetical protein